MQTGEYNRKFDSAARGAATIDDDHLISDIRAIIAEDQEQIRRGFRGRISCGDPDFSAYTWEARQRGLSWTG